MRYLLAILFLAAAANAYGSSYTVNEHGIDSLGLGLNGDGIEIGQIEVGRPGRPGYDTNPNLYVTNTIPKLVLENGGPAAINNLITIPYDDFHATQVASVLIGKDDPIPLYRGAAPAANLYANTVGNDVVSGALNTERIVTRSGVDDENEPIRVRAVNMSFGYGLQPFIEDLDGDSHFTQYIDGDDLQEWKDGFGTQYDGNDFLVWQRNFGMGVAATAVPEPSTILLSVLGLAVVCRRRA